MANLSADTHNPDAGFKRFWDHYKAMQSWITEYATAWDKVVDQQRNNKSKHSSSHNIVSSSKRHYPYNINSKHFSKTGARSKDPASKMELNSSKNHRKQTNSVYQASTEDESDCFVFEISDEMKCFFQQSQKHKEEREKEKDRLASAVDEDSLTKENQFKAPAEQPGSKRNTEMKILYGKYAPAIQGLETAIQMEFDHRLDRKQPQLWPSIALNL